MNQLDELLREVSAYHEQETALERSYSLQDQSSHDPEMEADVVREFLRREGSRTDFIPEPPVSEVRMWEGEGEGRGGEERREEKGGEEGGGRGGEGRKGGEREEWGGGRGEEGRRGGEEGGEGRREEGGEGRGGAKGR